MKKYHRSNRSEGRASGPRDFGAKKSFRSPGTQFYGHDNMERGFGKNRYSNRDSRPSIMHEAICSQCGTHCEVPFKPTGNRPVLCDICFKGGSSNVKPGKFKKDRAPKERVEDNTFWIETDGTSDNSSAYLKKQFEIVNDKLDKIINMLNPVSLKEEPLSDKPKKKLAVKPKKSKASVKKKE